MTEQPPSRSKPAASDSRSQPSSGAGENLRASTAMTMLGLAAARSTRPVDELIRRLRQPDGLSWLDIAVPTCGRTAPDQIAALLDGRANLEQMIAHKDRSKQQIAAAAGMDHAL